MDAAQVTILLYDIPASSNYSKALVELGIVANYETASSIQRLVDHVSRYLPDLRGVNFSEANWCDQIRGERILNYTYGFGLLRDSVRASLMLEAAGADYIGARPSGLFLSANKPHISALMASMGFSVPAERLVGGALTIDDAATLARHFVGESLVIKPAYEESSLGISLIANEPEAIQMAAVRLRAAVNGPIVIQEYVDGRDVTVPIVGRHNISCLPAVILQHDSPETGPFIFSADLKATKASVHYEVMAAWPPDVRMPLYNMAVTAFELAGLRDYARLDCRITESGQCYFLEINANPQLGLDKASFAVSAAAIGMEVGEVIWHMVNDESMPHGPNPLRLGY